MMSRITFMGSNVNGAINKNVEISVDLDEACIIPFIPIVSVPWLIRYIFKRKLFFLRQLKMLLRTSPAFLNSCFKNNIQFIFWNNKPVGQCLKSFLHSAYSGNERIQFGNQPIEMLLIINRSSYTEQFLRFFIKRCVIT